MLHGERRTVKVVIYRHSQDIRTQLKQPNTTPRAEYNKSSLSISAKKKVDFEVFTSDRGIPPIRFQQLLLPILPFRDREWTRFPLNNFCCPEFRFCVVRYFPGANSFFFFLVLHFKGASQKKN